jgi:hypothetical protein
MAEQSTNRSGKSNRGLASADQKTREAVARKGGQARAKQMRNGNNS